MENKEQIKKEIEELRRTVAYHARKYYVDDAPEISDYDYDMLYYRLLHLEEAHPEFFDPASPTQRVGGKPLDKFEKVTHAVSMNSLSDVFSYLINLLQHLRWRQISHKAIQRRRAKTAPHTATNL